MQTDTYVKGPLRERLARSRREDPGVFWSLVALGVMAAILLSVATYRTVNPAVVPEFARLP